VAVHSHHGVVPICRFLSTEEHQIAPSSVQSALGRPTCARRVVDRGPVTRLMSELEIGGATRSRSIRTTKPDKSSARAPDLVEREFSVDRPNDLWVADFTYVRTWSGFVYVALIIDDYSRFVVGWRVSSSMTTDLVMDALEMAVFSRRTRLISDVIARGRRRGPRSIHVDSLHRTPPHTARRARSRLLRSATPANNRSNTNPDLTYFIGRFTLMRSVCAC
jgi:transposase InsO family protein